jgi:hypothetical protein
MRISWLLRGSDWRLRHLRQCDKCYKRFEDTAPGAIHAASNSSNEEEQCLDFRGFSHLTRCPACAAPLWREAGAIARYRRHFD